MSVAQPSWRFLLLVAVVTVAGTAVAGPCQFSAVGLHVKVSPVTVQLVQAPSPAPGGHR